MRVRVRESRTHVRSVVSYARSFASGKTVGPGEAPRHMHGSNARPSVASSCGGGGFESHRVPASPTQPPVAGVACVCVKSVCEERLCVVCEERRVCEEGREWSDESVRERCHVRRLTRSSNARRKRSTRSVASSPGYRCKQGALVK